jgi:NarL family two-component system response regulator LiaR
MTESIRVLVADDHAVVREGLRALLRTEPGMELVGEASDGHQVVEQTRTLRPDVILLDLVMPQQDGVAAIRQILSEDPEAKILVLTSFEEDDKVLPAIRAGALGYLLKDSSPQELLQAIRTIARGESSLEPRIARKLLREMTHPPASPTEKKPLTERERKVLSLVALGLSNQEIAERLLISERTVRTHISNLLGKLGLENRTQAALFALREGLVKASSD